MSPTAVEAVCSAEVSRQREPSLIEVWHCVALLCFKVALPSLP